MLTLCYHADTYDRSLRSWRLEGIAYEFGDQVYDKPNRTMVSYAEGMMIKGEHRGLKKEMRSAEQRVAPN